MRSNKWTIYCYKSISWQYIIKIFNDWYSFLRFRDLLKSNFWSRRKPKYFWETLRSTGTWLKKTWGWNRVTVFREKITSWACLVRSWLNIIFHWYAHSEILFKSVSISSVETFMPFTVENLYISNLHAKPYQKLFAYPNIRNTFPKMGSYQKNHKFRALQTKIDLHMNQFSWILIDWNRKNCFLKQIYRAN